MELKHVPSCRLSELIGGIDIDVQGGSVKIVECKLKGEASVSLRRVSQYSSSCCFPHKYSHTYEADRTAHVYMEIFPPSFLQGKKFVFFEFSINCKWEGELVGLNGEIVGRGETWL